MKGEILRGHLDMLLLAALERGPAHGYAVIDLVNADSGGVFDLQQGTVYPILHRLETEGLIRGRWLTHAGRQRRLYELTRDGGKHLLAARADWQRFARGVTGVIGEAT
ncbi:MAG TPA: helix-turn-helix transcriptional regulator [Candidatus Limnocylindria bacterium]|nr:helix-turn-helix transcriptional regulator [Candidatus Limnocylindria bacterium]